MPIYDYKCTKCNAIKEMLAGFNDTTRPCACGGQMSRMISTHFGINMGAGAYGYYDENLQTYIHSNTHKKQVMQEQGVTEKYGKGWW
jgi:putative FmdB family regulatory protein